MSRSRSWVVAGAVGVGVVCLCVGVASAQYATGVVSYTPGAGVNAAFQDPTRALGEPSRFTLGAFPGAVTPFQSAFLGTQLVQVGRGGSLVVEFGRPILDDPANPFGVDFIVFGNAFLADASFPNGVASGAIAAEGGDIDVSVDGVTWVRVASNAADGLYPTLGYSDLTDPYSTTPGSAPSNFQRPVNPALSITPGTTFAQLVSAYDGSGGGFGVDLAGSGLASIRFVRISVDANATAVPEIDGFAIVPAPGAVALLALGAPLVLRRRR